MAGPSDHKPEWIYTTFLSKILCLSSVNNYIHTIKCLPHASEFLVFICGYSFNPVIIPLLLGLILRISYWMLMDIEGVSHEKENCSWRRTIVTMNAEQGALATTAFYLASVLITLAFTEIGKASFSTTRPTIPTSRGGASKISAAEGGRFSSGVVRRYGSLVSSLKSKHSFPSGDCAQAMNVCLFLWRYIPATSMSAGVADYVEVSMRDIVLFAVFLPGVAFARVFYHCHWIEDCFGGIMLSYFLHWLIIPGIGEKIVGIAASF